jgi:RNA polymerase sigma-70 factor (ECF subfamily)
MAESASPIEIGQLVADHHEVLFRYAYRLSGSVADAEDLTQQAFLIAHQKLDQVRERGSARSWLFTVLKNVYLRAQRKRFAVPSVSLLDIDSIPEELPDEFEIDRELLEAALNELPDEFRIVLVAYYFDDCSYREIAEQLGVPMWTVMSRLSRAKGHLRARLLEADFAMSARNADGGERGRTHG